MQIQELRNKTKLSQTQFAKRFNIPVATLRDWEQGRRKPPNYVIEMINKILSLENQEG